MSHGPTSAVSDERKRLVYDVAAVVCSFGGLHFGYDTGVISGALLCIGEDFAPGPSLQGLVVGLLLIGATVGALARGRLAGAFGRRRLVPEMKGGSLEETKAGLPGGGAG